GIPVVGLLPIGLVGAVLYGGVVNDEGDVGILQGGFLDVLRVGQVAENSRLVRVALVHRENLQPALAGFLVEPGRVIVVELEALAGAAGIGVAIPLPRCDFVLLELAVHLLDDGGLVRGIVGFVPIVVGGEVALADRAGGAGELIDLIARLRHQP